MNKKNDAPCSVLLVDDETQLLLGASVILRAAGIKPVQTIEDSRQVLPFLAVQAVSVVVLDLRMPHISGLELLPIITKNYPHSPVIVMAATSEKEIAKDCIKAGAFDFLSKPVQKEQFISIVKRGLKWFESSKESPSQIKS